MSSLGQQREIRVGTYRKFLLWGFSAASTLSNVVFSDSQANHWGPNHVHLILLWKLVNNFIFAHRFLVC